MNPKFDVIFGNVLNNTEDPVGIGFISTFRNCIPDSNKFLKILPSKYGICNMVLRIQIYEKDPTWKVISELEYDDIYLRYKIIKYAFIIRYTPRGFNLHTISEQVIPNKTDDDLLKNIDIEIVQNESCCIFKLVGNLDKNIRYDVHLSFN